MSIILILSKATSILLKDIKSTEKMCCESWIYALQYIKIIGGISDKEYAYSVEYIFNMLPKDCNMTFVEFGEYFEQRCMLYEELHCKVAKNENPPLAWGIIQHLVCTFPLQTVERGIVGPYALTNTSAFDNLNFTINSMSMFSFIHETLKSNKN